MPNLTISNTVNVDNREQPSLVKQNKSSELSLSPVKDSLTKSFSKTKPKKTVLEHWKNLSTDRDREFTGSVYDKSLVKRVYPDEIHGWEHTQTTSSLIQLAKNDAWEKCAIPPIYLAYTPNQNSTNKRYTIIDGHNRKNAAKKAGSCIPAIVTAQWTKNDVENFLMFEDWPKPSSENKFSKEWNPKNVPQKIYIKEGITENIVSGMPELEVKLQGKQVSKTLVDIAEKLNSFKSPKEFLNSKSPNSIIVRLSLDSAKLKSFGPATIRDLKIKINDFNCTDWKKILTNETTLKELLLLSSNSKTWPILNVQIQQNNSYFRTTGSYCP